MSHNFANEWRNNHEMLMAGTWSVAAASTLLISSLSSYSFTPFGLGAIGASVGMAMWRGWQAITRSVNTSRLNNSGKEFISQEKMFEIAKGLGNKKQLWLGKGFLWTDIQANKLQTLINEGIANVLGKVAANPDGAYWLQGLGEEGDLLMNTGTLVGHTLIVGTTRVGKTRLYDVLISQAIARGECVIIIDPKGDHELAANAKRACELAGDPDRFVYFHPAHPEKSACIDPMRNWNRRTELASRVAALISSETGSDPFTAFSWKVLNDLNNGMIATLKRPNLVKLRQYVEGGPDLLLLKTLRSYFTEHIEDWEKRASLYTKRMPNQLVQAYVAFYKDVVSQELPSPDIAGLISTFEHNREHFQKMVASLIPILSMLTSDSLRDLLSPEFEPGHNRVVVDMARIIKNNKVLYVGLDSLADPTVGSAIGSILLADLTAVAGDRYNYGVDTITPINLYIDEAAEVLNQPAIQLMNKGGGADFRVTIATQTFADFVARLGDENKARQVLANTNNKIALRVLDSDTQKYFAEGMTPFKSKSMDVSYGHSANANFHEEYSSAYKEQLKYEDGELFPAAMLGELPPLHFIARWSGGRVYKGKIPIIGVPKPQ